MLCLFHCVLGLVVLYPICTQLSTRREDSGKPKTQHALVASPQVTQDFTCIEKRENIRQGVLDFPNDRVMWKAYYKINIKETTVGVPLGPGAIHSTGQRKETGSFGCESRTQSHPITSSCWNGRRSNRLFLILSDGTTHPQSVTEKVVPQNCTWAYFLITNRPTLNHR